MKKIIITSVLAVMVALGTSVKAQDNTKEYLGLPGDNLNLYAVMKLFQESQTLEGFERSLNDPNSRINNLDLNGDNMIDYITVNDYVDGDVHTIVLRAVLNKNESQDVAVFTVQRFNDGSARIQLVGDEALYGKNYIIEPIYNDNETPNPGYTGRPANQVNVTVVRTTPFEVAAWPLVRFIFLPNYMIWRSRWYWGFYPEYWHPWRPFFWHYYYGYHYYMFNDYYAHYHRWNQFRYQRYDDFYFRGIRAHAPEVDTRINNGLYKETYSHPEQKSEGEAFYTKMNPGQNNRRPNNSGMNNQGRSVPQSNPVRSNAGNNSRNQQQPGSDVTNRSVSRRASDQNVNVTHSTAATPGKSVTRTDQTQRSVSSPAQNPRSVSVPSQTQRSVSRPEQAQRSETVRRSGNSAVKSSSHPVMRESKAVNSERKTGKIKRDKGASKR